MNVLDYLERDRDLLVDNLEPMQQPSVAVQNLGMAECADLLFRQMSGFGMAPQLLPTANYPVIYSRLQGISDYTLLIYGHYDVQPVTISGPSIPGVHRSTTGAFMAAGRWTTRAR